MFSQVLKVSEENLGESNTERRVKISAGISKTRPLMAYLLLNFGDEGGGLKLRVRYINRSTKISPKVKTYLNHLNLNIFGGGGLKI